MAKRKKEIKVKEPVRIREKVLGDGTISLYLDMYHKGNRKKEGLKLYIIPETTPAAKQQNKNTRRLAEQIKVREGRLSDYSLRHFGETDAGREADNLDIEYLNIGEINEIWHRDLPMEDETFAPLWPASRYRIEHEAGRILCLDEADPEDAAGAEDFRTARVFVMPEEADDQKRIAETLEE